MCSYGGSRHFTSHEHIPLVSNTLSSRYIYPMTYLYQSKLKERAGPWAGSYPWKYWERFRFVGRVGWSRKLVRGTHTASGNTFKATSPTSKRMRLHDSPWSYGEATIPPLCSFLWITANFTDSHPWKAYIRRGHPIKGILPAKVCSMWAYLCPFLCKGQQSLSCGDKWRLGEAIAGGLWWSAS